MPIRVDLQKAWDLADKELDISTDWLILYYKEKDPIDKQIAYLHYLKHARMATELYKRASQIIKDYGIRYEN